MALKTARQDIPTVRIQQMLVRDHEGKVRDAFVRRRNPVDVARTLSRKEPFHHQNESPTVSDSQQLSQGGNHEDTSRTSPSFDSGAA